MGYSCTTAAHRSLENIVWILKNESTAVHSATNTWDVLGTRFFWERGKENADGSITGCVLEFTGESAARRVGSFRINANGTIRSFPSSTKLQRQRAEMRAKENKPCR